MLLKGAEQIVGIKRLWKYESVQLHVIWAWQFGLATLEFRSLYKKKCESEDDQFCHCCCGSLKNAHETHIVNCGSLACKSLKNAELGETRPHKQELKSNWMTHISFFLTFRDF